MAAHQNCDLDTLGSGTKFEQLCNALLTHYFGPAIVPYGAQGPDGGIDALLDGLPQRSGPPSLIGGSAPKTSGLWVFQAKYHQAGTSPKTALTDLNAEWSGWKSRKSRPSYFLFMTNLVLTPALHQAFRKKAKTPTPFKFFDYWDGAKIQALVEGNQSIRAAYFPNCEDHVLDLKKTFIAVATTGSKEKKRSKKKLKITKSPVRKTKKAYVSSVEDLAKFESDFARANEEIVSRFKVATEETPKSWQKVDILAPKTGILKLADTGTDILLKLISASDVQSVLVKQWHKYLGEEVEKGEAILTLLFDPNDKELIELSQKSLFVVVPEAIDQNKKIDEEVKRIAKIAIASIRESDAFKAEAALRDLFKLRSQYITARSKYGVGFFPNSRRLGNITFGWSFLSIWDRAFERICDILLKQDQPDSLYRLIGNIPETLAEAAIDNRLPPEEVMSELSALTPLLYKAEKRKVDGLPEILYEGLENVFQHFYDLNHRLKGVEDAEWALSVADQLAGFGAEIGRASLKKDLKIDFGFSLRLIGLATSLYYAGTTSSAEVGPGWVSNYEKLQDLDRQSSLIQSEMFFALGTFAWFLCRNGRTDVADIAIAQLSGLPVKRVAELFAGRRGSLRRWYSWWFNPEGKRAVWSSRVDHDIRESLLVRLAIGPVSTEDLEGLSLLESQSSTDEFLKDLEIQYVLIRKLSPSTKLIPLAKIQAVVRLARKAAEKRVLDRIRGDQKFSSEKLSEIEESFRKTLREHDPSSRLYKVEINTDSNFKPEHYVGSYSIENKDWFLEDQGHVSHSVSGMGSGWAESIVYGRASLLVEKLKANIKFKEVAVAELAALLREIQQKFDENFVMIAHPLSIPWQLQTEFLRYKPQLAPGEMDFAPGQRSRIGKIDLFSARKLVKGQFAIFPKSTFTWLTTAIRHQPIISFIDPASAVGKQILERNPKMDLSLKVLVDAKEPGTMAFDQKLIGQAMGWQVMAAKDDDLV